MVKHQRLEGTRVTILNIVQLMNDETGLYYVQLFLVKLYESVLLEHLLSNLLVIHLIVKSINCSNMLLDWFMHYYPETGSKRGIIVSSFWKDLQHSYIHLSTYFLIRTLADLYWLRIPSWYHLYVSLWYFNLSSIQSINL